jgi:hypothetical protein
MYEGFIIEEYTDKKTGAKKTWYHRPGARLFPAKEADGFTLEIPPGISLSGRVIFRLPKPRKAGAAAEAEATASSDDEIPF